MPVRREIIVCQDVDELSLQAAERFACLAAEAVQTNGIFRVALAGGCTPRSLYERLAGEPYRSIIAWKRIEIFWGDERWVPPDHPESNRRLAWETLLAHLPVPAGHIHPMRTDGTPDEAAAAYEQEIRTAFGLPAEGGMPPRFDLILLGLGRDGHTASLFPGSSALGDDRRLVVAAFVPALGAYRLTLTLPVLCAAAHLVFLVSGEDKAAALRAALRQEPGEGGGRTDENDRRYPARLVRPHDGTVTWLVDRAAWGYPLPAPGGRHPGGRRRRPDRLERPPGRR